MRRALVWAMVVAVGAWLHAVAQEGVAPAGAGQPQLLPGAVRTQPPELPKPTGLTLADDAYPRTDGSTSAEPLGVWVACRLLGRPCAWPPFLWGDRRLHPLKPGAEVKPDGRWESDGPFYQRLRHHGTHDAYVRLIEGQTDLLFECRTPSADEQALMQQKGVELDLRVVALDAFVFLRHPENPVTGLTLAQVRDIYTTADNDGRKGKITRWNEVGGPEEDIHPFVREANSGSQETMQSLVMQERKIVAGREMMAATMMGPYNMLHRDKLGIGYTFWYYERYMAPAMDRQPRLVDPPQQVAAPPKPSALMFAIDGVKPTPETIAARTYPLVTEVYVVLRKGMPADHPAVKLRDWLLTPEGQAVVAETGYAPVQR